MKDCLLFSFLAVAGILDFRFKRIPNTLTIAMALSGLVIAAFSGWEGMRSSILGFLFGLLAGIIIWLMGGFKAGDAKLFAAAGAVNGISNLAYIYAWSFASAAIAGAIYLIRKRELIQRMLLLWHYFKGMVLQRKLSAYPAGSHGESNLPFAFFVFCGAVIARFARSLIRL